MALDFNFNVDPGDAVSPASLAARRKIATALLQQGTDASPIQYRAWTQGLARMANALIGGYDLGAADREEKQATQKAIADYMAGQTPAASPILPSSPGAPATFPRAPGPIGQRFSEDEPNPPYNGPPITQAAENVQPWEQGSEGGFYPPKAGLFANAKPTGPYTGPVPGPPAAPPSPAPASPQPPPTAAMASGGPAPFMPPPVNPALVRALGSQFLPPALAGVAAGQLKSQVDPYGSEAFKNLEIARHNRATEEKPQVLPMGASLVTPQGQEIFGGGNEDAKAIADSIKSGKQPPDTAGLSRTVAPRVRAMLANDGFDLTQAKLQYDAAHKQILSLNGPQMVRYVGLATSVDNTIDEVKQLAAQMDNIGIPIANYAKAVAYTQAAGNTPQGQLVAKYVAAVNTLKEEFANLAQGGYAPTEAAWGLANQQINGNFGVKQLGASLDEVQRLIRYRIQGIPNINTLGPGAGNRYVPGVQQPGATGGGSVSDPLGIR